MGDNILSKTDGVDYIETETTTFEIHSFYSGGVTLDELIKNALRRDAEGILRRMDNN